VGHDGTTRIEEEKKTRGREKENDLHVLHRRLTDAPTVDIVASSGGIDDDVDTLDDA
jgi:hypothetical protein